MEQHSARARACVERFATVFAIFQFIAVYLLGAPFQRVLRAGSNYHKTVREDQAQLYVCIAVY